MTAVADDVLDAQRLLDQAADALIYADLSGTIRYWNAAAARIFGHSPAQAVGENLDLIVPEQFRAAHWAGYERATAAGVTKYAGQALTTRSVRADGSTLYVELSFAIIHATDGTVTGVLAHARDVTERFERDRAARRRLRQLEEQLASAPADQGPPAGA